MKTSTLGFLWFRRCGFHTRGQTKHLFGLPVGVARNKAFVRRKPGASGSLQASLSIVLPLPRAALVDAPRVFVQRAAQAFISNDSKQTR